jgi:GT2 family glycosyltransferase
MIGVHELTPQTVKAAKVAVCAITYRRRAGLEKLLANLASQTGVEARDLLVVVVDNDPELSARPVVEVSRARGLPIAYDHEPVPGIPRARNRSVLLALQSGARRLCFIDDDEFPSPNWLERLLAHADSSDAAVVSGPVISILPQGAPRWIERSRLFSRPRHATGARRDRAATNNALVDRRVFDVMKSWFDESIPLNGSDDSDFFRRVRRAGFTIESCDEAVVYEDVPRERCTLRWILRRNFRGGLAFADQSRRYEGWRQAVRSLVVGSSRLLYAAVLSVLTLGLVPAARLRIVENAGLGAGLVLGGFGITIDEYRRG